MKYLRFILYFFLALVLMLIALMIWPKGSIDKQRESTNVPAIAYAIIDNGEISELEVVGELEEGRPALTDAIFNVASVTKPVFSIIALKLIDSGVLGLDEPVHPYWIDQDITNDVRHKLLTPRILLSHQSGFPNWRWNNEDRKLGFGFDPGKGYQYSGEGFEYLKYAIQSKTGLLFEHLADSLLFDPLKMDNSWLVWDESMDESRFAIWHNKSGDQYETFKRQEACAADDLMTTLSDMCKFAKYVMEMNGGLSDDLFNEMVTPQVEVTSRTAYGLGWEVVPDLPGNEYALVHGGSDIGVRARIVLLPGSKRAFIAFSNSDNGQKIIDRIMVSKFAPGADVISKIYAPIIWRIIYLPFNI